MRRAKGALLSLASLVGFVLVLVGHAVTGTSSAAGLGNSAGGGGGQKPPTSKPPSSGGGGGTATQTGTHSATGKVEGYGYGEIAVRLTVDNGKIVSVKVAKLATAESYSQQLAQQAIPLLTREVLSAQSARISAISGATYTSEGYAYSVQSALDALKRK